MCARWRRHKARPQHELERGGGGVAPFLGCEAVAQLGDRFAAADEILELPAPSNTFETRMETYVG